MTIRRCPTCEGQGATQVRRREDSGRILTTEVTCPTCHGDGYTGAGVPSPEPTQGPFDDDED